MTAIDRATGRIRQLRAMVRLLDLGRAFAEHELKGMRRRFYPAGLPPMAIDRVLIREGLATIDEVAWAEMAPSALSLDLVPLFKRELRTVITDQGKIVYLRIYAEQAKA